MLISKFSVKVVFCRNYVSKVTISEILETRDWRIFVEYETNQDLTKLLIKLHFKQYLWKIECRDPAKLSESWVSIANQQQALDLWVSGLT